MRGWKGDDSTAPATTAAAPAQTSAAPVTDTPGAGSYTGPLSGVTIAGEPFAWFMGLGLALFLAGRLRKHPAIPGAPADMAVSTYNFFAVGLTAITSIVALKALSAKYPVPGLSTVIAAA